MKENSFLNLVLACILIVILGHVLIVGRSILLPIVTAVISVYLLDSASNTLRRLPAFRRVPEAVLRVLLLTLFTMSIFALAVLVAATVREISSVAPKYEANFEAILDQIAIQLHLDRQSLWDEIKAVSIDKIDFGATVKSILGSFGNFSGTVFVIILYASFIAAEQHVFGRKVAAFMGDTENTRRTLAVVREINGRISAYIGLKTLINIALGFVSYLVLWYFQVDFALFWAISIGFLNYIPYVGSYIGVAFPVVISIAQFGSLTTTLVLTILLTAVQFVLGSIIEPKLIGRRLNISPLVVLVALSVWTAIWGIPGAILAVPMTAMLAIILDSFDATRPFTIFLADRVAKDRPTHRGGISKTD